MESCSTSPPLHHHTVKHRYLFIYSLTNNIVEELTMEAYFRHIRGNKIMLMALKVILRREIHDFKCCNYDKLRQKYDILSHNYEMKNTK